MNKCPECDDELDYHRKPADVWGDNPFLALRAEEWGEDIITCIMCENCSYDVGERSEQNK